MFRFNLCVALFAAVLITIICQPAMAVSIYSEDFEGATLPQTILDPPISWTNASAGWTTALVPITQGSSPLNSTQVVQGTGTGPWGFDAPVHPIASPAADSIYTLTADTYFLGGFAAHDTFIGLADSGISAGWDNASGAFIRNDWTGGDLGLQFDLTGFGGGVHKFSDGFAMDTPSSIEIIVDLGTEMAYGTVNDGTTSETLSAAIDVTSALGLNQISICQNQGGFDLDNIQVTGTVGLVTGDLNGDGYVDNADRQIVKDFLGQTVTPGDLLSGDPSGDGFVGGDDYDIVRANWLRGTPPEGASSVPEPGSLTMLALGSLVLVALRRRHQV